jgi:hypothetical protein
MALLFISNRRGFDERAGGQTKIEHTNYPD